MGGVWERQIQTVRSVLSSILKILASRLDEESLRTLFVEVEAIVNSRPLTVESLTDENSDPLTPNHLLTILNFLSPRQAVTQHTQKLLAFSQ